MLKISANKNLNTLSKAAGIGFLMTPRAHSCLISWEPISERLITARFRSKIWNITLIQCYAPTRK